MHIDQDFICFILDINALDGESRAEKVEQITARITYAGRSDNPCINLAPNVELEGPSIVMATKRMTDLLASAYVLIPYMSSCITILFARRFF